MTITPLQRNILLGWLLILALASLTTFGVLENSNLSMSDRIFQLSPNQQNTPPILLVSTTEMQRAQPNFIKNLILKLSIDQPKIIYLLGQEEKHYQKKQPGMDWLKSVVFVDSVSRLKHAKTAQSEVTNLDNQVYMTEVKLKGGHFRKWQNSQSFEGRVYPAFQRHAQAIGNTSGKAVNNSSNTIIDFSMEDGFLPLVSARRVLNDALSPGLVTNNFILIGPSLEPGHPGFTVPIRPNSGISLLELQGYALHSALSNRFIHFSGFFTTLVGVLIIGSLSVVLFQWFPPQFSLIYSISICLLFIFIQWLSIKYIAWMLPTWEWILTQIISMLAVYQLRRNKEELALNRIIAEANSRLGERVQPLNFNRSNDPWKKILSFVNQQLNLKRSIFLEKLPKDHRIREIEALDCSIDDISEYRRDYQRAPYSDALKVNAPIEPFRDYFKEVEENETQYLTPLTFAGEIMGFWALTLKPDKKFDKIIFENNLRVFSDQISELLYHRNHWKLHYKKTHSSWRKLISLEIGQSLHKKLNRSVTLLEHRLDTLEDVFNGLSTAAIVYDVFGQVLLTNKMIESLAQDNNIAIYKLTAMELLARSGDMDLDQARKKIRYVTLKDQTVTINSRAFSSETSHLLKIRPLHTQKRSHSDQVHPFQILGILFEFIDISLLQQHMNIRQGVENLYFQLMRNNLSIIALANRQLIKKDNSTSRWSNLIRDKVTESGLLTSQIEDQSRHPIYMGEGKVVAVDIIPTISHIINSLKEFAQNKDIKFIYHKPELHSLCYIELVTFEQLINAILMLLISDGAHNSILSIIVFDETEKSGRYIKVNFNNTGNGIPSEQLEKSLTTKHIYTNSHDELLMQISIIANQVRSWGGSLDILTKIGSGFSIELALKIFILKPTNAHNTVNDES